MFQRFQVKVREQQAQGITPAEQRFQMNFDEALNDQGLVEGLGGNFIEAFLEDVSCSSIQRLCQLQNSLLAKFHRERVLDGLSVVNCGFELGQTITN